MNVFRRYKERKRDANAMDFDDLLVSTGRCCSTSTRRSPASLKRRFRHILVDEYQDTNKLQADIVDAMASVRRNVMVVGDDAQSIYSFRGASFENILTFPLRFPDATIYKLETNYRSTRQILHLANASIAANRFQFRKELQAVRGDGPDPAVVGVDDVFEQASFVAQRILELRDEGERSRRDRRALPLALPVAGAADGAHPPATSPTRSAPACASSSRRTSRTCSPI